MLKAEEMEDAPKVVVGPVPSPKIEESTVGREYLHHTDPEKAELQAARQEAEEEEAAAGIAINQIA